MRIIRNQRIGPDGRVTHEDVLELPDLPDLDALLKQIEAARTLPEFRQAVVAYLRALRPSEPDVSA